MAFGNVETGDFAQLHFDILLPLENRPQWRGDIGGRQFARGNLIQQRLKEMKIAAVDERDLNRRGVEPRAAFSPPNPPPTITTRWGTLMEVSRCCQYP